MKKALITGSSRGIGRAIALKLASEGYHIIIHCASTAEKAGEVKNIIEKNGGSAEIFMSDLCDAEKTAEIPEKYCGVDVLVLNASLQVRRKWEEIPLSECLSQLNCNYTSSLLLIQKAVPYMKKAGGGRIVIIGSVQEAKPHPDMLVYSASKAALSNTVRSLSIQLAPYGITVNNIAPGVIYTDRNKEALADKEYAELVKSLIPVGYYGEPEDIAEAVAFICSDKARYIVGQTVYVDGGKSIQ